MCFFKKKYVGLSNYDDQIKIDNIPQLTHTEKNLIKLYITKYRYSCNIHTIYTRNIQFEPFDHQFGTA